jgi:hypothetical protein
VNDWGPPSLQEFLIAAVLTVTTYCSGLRVSLVTEY